MLVEFFGIPGSGKSTMSRRVADILLASGILIDEITYDLDHVRQGAGRLASKFAYILRYTIRHPILTLSFVKRILMTKQKKSSDLYKSIFNGLFVASLAARRRSVSRITLLDQGVAQALWSIGFAARREAWLDVLLSGDGGTVCRPDLIAQVTADSRAVADRLGARERRVSRLEDDLGGGKGALLRAEVSGEMIIARLKADDVPAITVRNDDVEQLGSGARLVAQAIVTLLAERGVASEVEQRRGDVPA